MEKFKLPPMKLTYDKLNNVINFVPQTSQDIIDTQILSDKLNAILKDTKSDKAVAAKSFSDELKAAIEKKHSSKI
jgi:hypothetical protein